MEMGFILKINHKKVVICIADVIYYYWKAIICGIG